MNKLIKIIFTVSIICLATSIFADNTGCGLGTMIFKGKTGKGFELLAVTTNTVCANQTFAITSGTAEYKAGAPIARAEIERFVDQNMDSLAVDMSQGQGEYLDTLSVMMNIENKAAFNETIRSNFNEIYTHEDVTSEEVVANIYSVIES